MRPWRGREQGRNPGVLLLTGRVFSHSLQAVRQAFADQDPEGCGVLGRKAFAAAMESLDLGLSPQVRIRHPYTRHLAHVWIWVAFFC